MIMAYPEGSGHGIIKVVYSNAKNEYYLAKLMNTTESQDIRCSCSRAGPVSDNQKCH